MKRTRSLAITVVALTALSIPLVLLAQRGHGGGAGGVGRASTMPAPSPTRGPSNRGGGPVSGGLTPSESAVTRLENNAALARQIQPMLPPGSDLHTAATGFRNEGDFIAALHASRNLGIPFDQVKSQMTGDKRRSLGDAIRTLRPDLDKKTVNENVKTAQRMTNGEIHAAKAGRTESAAAAEIRSNPKLSERLTPLLPAGMSFDRASDGFKNTGQFVAALHVAKNLNIPFGDLRARMIAGGESLGEAIHSLRPEMPAAEIQEGVSRATRVAQGDLQAGEDAGASSRVRQ